MLQTLDYRDPLGLPDLMYWVEKPWITKFQSQSVVKSNGIFTAYINYKYELNLKI